MPIEQQKSPSYAVPGLKGKGNSTWNRRRSWAQCALSKLTVHPTPFRPTHSDSFNSCEGSAEHRGEIVSRMSKKHRIKRPQLFLTRKPVVFPPPREKRRARSGRTRQVGSYPLRKTPIASPQGWNHRPEAIRQSTDLGSGLERIPAIAVFLCHSAEPTISSPFGKGQSD